MATALNTEGDIAMSNFQEFIIRDGVLLGYRGDSSEIIIPEGVHTIDMLAFSKDKRAKIERIQFPLSLELIEDWSFDHCEKLTRIVIPVNVKKIGAGAFNWCPALCDVVFEGNPAYEKSTFGWTQWEKNALKDTGATIVGDELVKVHPDVIDYIVPSHIKVIGRDAFKNTQIKRIIIPDGVKEIGICAFMNTPLECILLPNTLETIGAYAFDGCTNLREITIPDSVSRVDDTAFNNVPHCVITYSKGKRKKKAQLVVRNLNQSAISKPVLPFDKR